MTIRMLGRTAALLLVLSIGAAAQEKAEDKVPLVVFPNAVGSEWTFQNGAMQITERIAAYEKIGDEECARLDTIYDGKVVASEHIAFRQDGIYRVAIAGKRIEPPFLFVKLPPEHGAQWKVKCRVDGADLSGDFNSLITEVTVPAGKFQALSVLGKNFKAGDKKLEFETAFAPGVGKVRHAVRIDGRETLLELKAFAPGPADAPTADDAKP